MVNLKRTNLADVYHSYSKDYRRQMVVVGRKMSFGSHKIRQILRKRFNRRRDARGRFA